MVLPKRRFNPENGHGAEVLDFPPRHLSPKVVEADDAHVNRDTPQLQATDPEPVADSLTVGELRRALAHAPADSLVVINIPREKMAEAAALVLTLGVYVPAFDAREADDNEVSAGSLSEAKLGLDQPLPAFIITAHC